MPNSDRPGRFQVYQNLAGGMSTRNSPLVIENSSSEALKSPSLLNCEFFSGGAVRKRLGKILATSSPPVAGTATWASHTYNTNATSYSMITPGLSGVSVPIVAPSTQNIYSYFFSVNNPYLVGQCTNLYGAIYTDSSGLPGTLIATSSNTIPDLALGFAPFTFSTPVPVINGTKYHFCFFWTLNSVPTQSPIFLIDTSAPTTSVPFYNSVGHVGWFNTTGPPLNYVITQINNTSINGLYDYHVAATGAQKHMAAANGSLFYDTGLGTWTSLNSGFGSGANNIWSFSTLQNLLFSTDYSVTNPQVWNGTASYTMNLGFRPTATIARAASGGTVTTGVYQVMLVTTLASGGYRAGPVSTITTTATTDKISATAVSINGTGASDFGFDIGALATEVWMTLIGGSTFYKLATASVSVGNPLANSTTSFNITAPPVGTENTLVLEYSQTQAYFTQQVSTPKGKFLEIFQNMLCMAGDPLNPSRVWFSPIGQPQIWSTYGGILGNFIDLNLNDGESITGIKQWNGQLYVFKRHSIFLIQYTGVANSPLISKQLATNFGALSHWSIQDIGSNGLIYLSERGPVVCLGTYVIPIPATNDILDRFQVTSPTSYNISVMYATTSAVNIGKNQVWWSVSSNGSSLRNLTLVYDYEHQIFWENDVVSNVFADILDINLLQQIWSSDYSGNIYIQDSGTNDAGSAISWNWSTPLLQLGDPFFQKQITGVFVSGSVQSSGALFCDVYLENSATVNQTLVFDMTRADFKSGQSAQLNKRGRMVRFNFRNSDLNVPVEIDSVGFDWVRITKEYQ